VSEQPRVYNTTPSQTDEHSTNTWRELASQHASSDTLRLFNTAA